MRSLTIGFLTATLLLFAGPASAGSRTKAPAASRGATRSAADFSRRGQHGVEETAPWIMRHRTSMPAERVVASRFNPAIGLYARLGLEPTSLREVVGPPAQRRISAARQILLRRAPSRAPLFTFLAPLRSPADEGTVHSRLFAFNQLH